jgi:hypothetical protein
MPVTKKMSVVLLCEMCRVTASSRHPSRPYLGELEFTCTCHVDVKNEKSSLRSGLKNTSLGPRPLVYFGVGVGERKFSGTRKSHYHNETTTGRRHRDAYPFITPVECCHSATCTCTRHTAVLLQETPAGTRAISDTFARICKALWVWDIRCIRASALSA